MIKSKTNALNTKQTIKKTIKRLKEYLKNIY